VNDYELLKARLLSAQTMADAKSAKAVELEKSLLTLQQQHLEQQQQQQQQQAQTSKQLQALEETRRKAETERDQVEAELERATSRAKDLGAKLAQREQQGATLEQVKTELDRKIDQVEKLESELELVQKMFETKAEELKDAQSHGIALNLQLESLRTEKSNSDSLVAELVAQLDLEKKQTICSAENTDAIVTQLRSKLVDAERKTADLERTKSQLKDRLEELLQENTKAEALAARQVEGLLTDVMLKVCMHRFPLFFVYIL